MRSHLARLTLYSQATFFGFLLVCIVLRPDYLFSRNEGGISNYGVHLETVVPYTCALGATAVLLGLAARATPRAAPEGRRYAAGLWTFGVLLACVLASTYAYQHGPTLHDLHFSIGAVTVVFEAVWSTWLVAALRGESVERAAWASELCGVALAACTVAGVLHALFVSQLITSGAFGVLLVRGAARLGAAE